MADPVLIKIDESIERRFDETVAELSRLCAQPSISAQGLGMAECAELVAGLLRARGLRAEVMPTAGHPIVFAETEGRGGPTLLFYNHYDVQPPEPLDQWDSPPFEPTLRDGKLFARGVSDDKGHLICRLAALDALVDALGRLPCSLKFIVEGEEETSSTNLHKFVEDNAERLKADACLWEFGYISDEGVSMQHLGLRGICYVELSVETGTLDAHSGLGGSIFPNAAWRLTWALNALKGPDERIRIPGFYDAVRPPTQRDLELLKLLPDTSAEHKRLYGLKGFIKGLTGGLDLRREAVFSPTCTICGITSGYQGPGSKTVLPARASAKVDFRLVPDQHPDEVLRQLRAYLDAEGFDDVQITYLGGDPPARVSPDDPFVQLVVRTAKDVYGQEQMIVPIGGGSGPNYPFIHHLKLPVATAGISHSGSRIHAPNENIRLDYLKLGIRHTARIIEAFSRQ